MTGLPGLLALLLSFALLVSGEAFPWLYALQCAAVALAALGMAVSGDPWAGASAAVLLVQAGLGLRSLSGGARRPPATPLLPLGGATVLTAFAAAVCPLDGFAPPLATALVGLLAAALAPDGAAMRFGVLVLLNGAAGACCLRPGSLLPVSGLAVAAAAVGGFQLPRRNRPA